MQAKPDAGPDAAAEAASDPRSDAASADAAATPADVVPVTADAPMEGGKDTRLVPDAGADTVLPTDPPRGNDALAADAGKDANAVDLLEARADGAQDLADAVTDVADARTDSAAACTPGMDQTCNDSDLVSSVWGRCNSDGTCACSAGYTVNPSTGRCMIGARDAATVGDGPAPGCTNEFVACGCGCCGGTTPTTVCYYPELGETTAWFAAQDEQTRQGANCAMAGCSLGRRYVCCVAGSREAPGSASYTADAYMGDSDHLTIRKSGGDCAELVLVRPSGSGDDRLPLQTNGNWKLAAARAGACVDGGPTDPARGVLGTVVVRKGGDGCVADVHLSLFAFTATGEVKTARLDADGVPIGGMGDGLCLW
jgi:hypothetical protein